MVYIIGLDHLVQYNGPVPDYLLGEFRECLSGAVARFNITVIAEEFNSEYLHDVLGATEDTAEVVAGKLGIEHVYCDPDERERMKLGIPYYADVKDRVKLSRGITDKFITDDALRREVDEEIAVEVRKYWGIRERFWLDRIRDKLGENVLFLCGHEHVIRFRDLLVSEGADAIVIDEFWRGDLFSDYRNIGLL